MKNYLKEQGKQLIEMGYYVIPIQDGMKQPNMKEWTKLGTNQIAQLDKWVNGTLGETRHGVGIMTGSHYDNVIGLDVDVLVNTQNGCMYSKAIRSLNLTFTPITPAIILLNRWN